VCEFERWTTRRLDAGAKLCVFLEYIIGCVCVSTHQRVGIVAQTLAFFLLRASVFFSLFRFVPCLSKQRGCSVNLSCISCGV
jgi:hypothetical protein